MANRQITAGELRARGPKPLSPTQIDLVLYMRAHGRKITRHPGGFWAHPTWTLHTGGWFGTPTVATLVRRGVAKYTRWQEGRNHRFPIEVSLAEQTDGQ